MAEEKKAVEFLARKGEGRMSDTDFQSVVKNGLSECVNFIDGELSVDRARATDYYAGKPFGNEEDGRSQAILTEVRDAVDGMIPSLMRVFFGAEHTVEFVPTRADNVEQAAQKTDYVRYVFEEDNNGFLETMAVLKDGLVRKIGIFTWGFDTSGETRAFKLEGLTEQELQAIAADDELNLTSVSRRDDGFVDVELTKAASGRTWVKSVPPEEFIYNRQARSLDEALIAGHRTEKTRGELLAMGISKEDIDEHGGAGDSSRADSLEEIARRDMGAVGSTSGVGSGRDPEMGRANDKILYCDVAMNVDFDGDGKAELRRVCAIGTNYYPVKNDPADEKRFAIFTPYPEPHSLLGGSVADRTMDIQKINSALLRGMLDSLALSLFPRTVYKEGSGNVADIMNTAIGAPVREREVNTVRILEHTFTGRDVLPILAFTQEVIERRTGRNKGAAGLDADALQSTGKEAVGAVLTGSQEQIEVIARVFAEGTLKPLFRGLGRLLQQKQPRARLVRLRGKWVDVDPKSWDDNMDVTVNVALGTTFTEKKIATLLSVAADQENIMEKLGGLSNPAVPLQKLLNTRAQILKLQGIKDFESYYNALPSDWAPPPQPAAPPDPSIIAMQAEAEMSHVKAMKELAIKQDELQLKIQQMEDDRNAEAFERQFKFRELEINAELEKAKIELELNKLRAEEDLNAVQTALATSEHLSDVEIENRKADIEETKANKPTGAE